MHATAIDHVNLRYPPDRLGEVLEFYVGALGFGTEFEAPYEAIEDDPGLFRIVPGEGISLFVNPDAGFDPGARNYRHVALRIPETPESLRETLAEAGVGIDHEADREREHVGTYTSYYVTDPFGYTVELMAVGDGGERNH
ncbi:MAG: VOC family protein [Halobacteriales archaeon]